MVMRKSFEQNPIIRGRIKDGHYKKEKKKDDKPVAIAEKEVKGYKKLGRWIKAHDRTIIIGVNALLALVGEYYIRKHKTLARHQKVLEGQLGALKSQSKTDKGIIDTLTKQVDANKATNEALETLKPITRKLEEQNVNLDARQMALLKGTSAVGAGLEEAKTHIQSNRTLITSLKDEYKKIGKKLAKYNDLDKILNHPDFKKFLKDEKNLKDLRPARGKKLD